MAEHLGSSWSGRENVRQAENGRRAFVPSDIVAFAETLARPPGWFYEIHPGVDYPSDKLQLSKTGPEIPFSDLPLLGGQVSDAAAVEIDQSLTLLSVWSDKVTRASTGLSEWTAQLADAAARIESEISQARRLVAMREPDEEEES
jgi:hypothetical protein